MKNIAKKTLLALTIGSAANLSFAALQQGTLGATSTGSFDITAVLQDLVQISSLDNLALGTYTGTGDMTGSESFCVYRNGTGQYQATVTGSYNAGAGSGFVLSDGTNTMAYTVTYNGTGIASGGVTATQAGNASLQDCGGANVANNATIGVTVPAATLQGSPTGTYTGTVTILIGPM